MQNKEYKFKTLEEYRAYQREKSKEWYRKNRERKIAYQKARYYNLKKQKETNQEQI